MKKKFTGVLIAILAVFLLLMVIPGKDSGGESGLTPEKTVATDKLTESTDQTDSEKNDPTDARKDPGAADIGEDQKTDALSKTSPEMPKDMEIHFLDVGQGLSILVKSAGQTLLYDGGSRNSSSFVVSYLKNQGISTIDYMISSHYDEDHVSGLIGCLNAFTVKNVISSDYVHDSNLYQSFLDAVSSANLTCQHPSVGTSYSFGTGSFTILAPAEIDPNDSNENSVAIRLTNGNNHFIFTGDAESGSEADMIASGQDLSCDVLCLGHHGSASSSSSAFLMATVPEYAVISCGKNNSYGHPHDLVMEYLSSMELPVFRTDIQGTVIAFSDGTDITWNTDPCNDYTPGDTADSASGQSSNSQASVPPTATPTPETSAGKNYVLNNNTKKFHYSSCHSAEKIKPENRSEYTGTRDELISMGYDPCGNCKP